MNGNDILIFVVIAVILFSLSYMIDRWLNPWLAKRSINKILRDIKEGKPPKPRNYDFEITFDSNNIFVLSLKNKSVKPASIAWRSIKRATAFKRDLFTVDCVCLVFETADGMTFEINEDMKGWLNCLEAMPKYLPDCKPLSDWIFQITTPAFAANTTEIFLRP